ncbi:hypothetical protein OAF54_02735 [bacterium]|nr:hypothetical protein [bacterium]
MSTGKKGGYTAINIGTTVGMSTTVPILALWNGTTIGEGEGLTGEDAGGNTVGTGTRQSPVIRTTSISAGIIATIEGYKNACTPVWTRWYTNGGGRILVGPLRVSAVKFAGASAGELHQYIIELSAFEEDSTDFISVEA